MRCINVEFSFSANDDASVRITRTGQKPTDIPSDIGPLFEDLFLMANFSLRALSNAGYNAHGNRIAEFLLNLPKSEIKALELIKTNRFQPNSFTGTAKSSLVAELSYAESGVGLKIKPTGFSMLGRDLLIAEERSVYLLLGTLCKNYQFHGQPSFRLILAASAAANAFLSKRVTLRNHAQLALSIAMSCIDIELTDEAVGECSATDSKNRAYLHAPMETEASLPGESDEKSGSLQEVNQPEIERSTENSAMRTISAVEKKPEPAQSPQSIFEEDSNALVKIPGEKLSTKTASTLIWISGFLFGALVTFGLIAPSRLATQDSQIFQMRKWKSITGTYSIDARLVEYGDRSVKLQKPDGKAITVLLEKLSNDDLEFLVQNRIPCSHPSNSAKSPPK